jgi:hypothetical protein
MEIGLPSQKNEVRTNIRFTVSLPGIAIPRRTYPGEDETGYVLLTDGDPPREIAICGERINTMSEVKSKLVILGVILWVAIVCSIALAQAMGPVTNAVVGPLPPPPIPPNLIKLTPVEQLGKFMLYDHTLSNPSGYACATCHVLQTGFTGPNSEVNLFGGEQPGVVPGRFGNRKPQMYAYAAFAPVGPVFFATKGVWVGGDFWDGRVPDLSGQAKQPPLNPNEMNNTPGDRSRPFREGFHRFSLRSSKTGLILISSCRYSVRTRSRNFPRSRSTNYSLWQPPRTSPRER